MSLIGRNKASHMLWCSFSGTVMPWLHVRHGALHHYQIAIGAGENPSVAALKANIIVEASTKS